MQRSIDVVVLIAVGYIVVIELLGNLGCRYARLDQLLRIEVGFTAEQNYIAPLAFQLAQYDRVADCGRVAVDLGGQVQLYDVALLELAVAGAGDGVAGGCLREDIHRQACSSVMPGLISLITCWVASSAMR